MIETFERWSAYILAAFAGGAGLLWGMKRAQIGNAFRLDQITHELEKLERRVKDLETQGAVSAISLARIEATLLSVLEHVRELNTEMRKKVDK